MKVLTVVFLLLHFISVSFTKEVYNIGILIPMTSHSHRTVLLSLGRELLNRGHKLTVLSNLKPVLHHPNATEITHNITVHIGDQSVDMFKLKEEQGDITLKAFTESLSDLAKHVFHIPEVMDLYRRRHEFDLFICDANFNEPIYPILHGVPFILVATPGKLPTYFAVQGNPLNPAYVPFLNDYDRPWTFLNRMTNLAETVFLYIAWRHYVVPYAQREITPQFPELPSLLDIERNVSLVLMNSHFTLDFVTPLLPSQLEVAGMHCRPSQALPKDLLDWIEGSHEHGVVYFSLGSITRGNSMPSHIKEMFIKAFARLKQRVVWKFEEDIPNLPDNVMIKKWMPQQDIIAHPKVKVFISHGGLLGLQEAMYHATPLLVLPIFGDQGRNCKFVERKGFGVCGSWKTISEDIIVENLLEIINNKKYKNNLEEISKIWKDKPMSSLETAVWWTEYVIRNKGAPQLKCVGASLSWVQFLMLDQIAVIIISLLLIKYTIKKMISLCRKKKKTQKKKHD